MASLIRFSCPKCGRSVTELHGPLMSDMGRDRYEKRERRRNFMRGFRDRVRGVERAEPSEPDSGWYEVSELTCRRCRLPMVPTTIAMVD